MKNKNLRLILPCLIAICALCPAGAGVQGQVPEGFPAALLQGDDAFDFALLLQGDARGNYGPCG